MARIQTRQDFAEFCLRQLGAPVINIEVADEQLEDAVSMAIKFYQEYHYDGIERGYLTHRLTGTQITVIDATIFSIGQKIYSMDGNTYAQIAKIEGNIITVGKQVGFTKLALNDTIKNELGVTTQISSIVLGDIENGYITVDDSIMGVEKILNISSVLGSADYTFSMQYQVMLSEMQTLTKSGVQYFYETMNYLAHLDFIMRKEKNYRFNRRTNKLVLEIAWATDVKVDDILVAEVYRVIDETAYPEVYSDRWLGKYATALIKRIWGTNLRKYDGLQLPGGVTFNGQRFFDEATDEIKELEQEALENSAPLEFQVG